MVIVREMNDKGKINLTTFDRYLLSEYDHIAEAHFRVNETITAFFRYYLLIMSIPISIIAAFVAIGLDNNFIVGVIEGYVPVVVAVFLVIGCAGFGVLLYLVTLEWMRSFMPELLTLFVGISLAILRSISMCMISSINGCYPKHPINLDT
jgi:hypothetical protein